MVALVLADVKIAGGGAGAGGVGDDEGRGGAGGAGEVVDVGPGADEVVVGPDRVGGVGFGCPGDFELASGEIDDSDVGDG